VNCSDFPNWAAANAWFQYHFPIYGDIAGLDADHDGIPCETLPGAPVGPRPQTALPGAATPAARRSYAHSGTPVACSARPEPSIWVGRHREVKWAALSTPAPGAMSHPRGHAAPQVLSAAVGYSCLLTRAVRSRSAPT
jgi:hypothetical protein